MRKSNILLLLLVLAGCYFLFTSLQKHDGEKASELMEKDGTMARTEDQEPAPSRADDSASPQEMEWVDMTLSHQLNPEALEAWAQNHALTLNQEIKGHPRSGQRLEISWGSEPRTTAVFDVIGEKQYQLSAVRSLYPAGANFSELRSMLQDKVKRPIEREDENSVVFTADERGLTVWVSRLEDGSVKVAYEYGAHSHAAEPLP